MKRCNCYDRSSRKYGTSLVLHYGQIVFRMFEQIIKPHAHLCNGTELSVSVL